MNAARISVLFLFFFGVLWFCALPTGCWGSRRWLDGLPEVVMVDPTVPESFEIDEEMEQQMWLNCKPELLQTWEALQNSDAFHSEEITTIYSDIHPKARSLTRGSLQKFFKILPPDTKNTLLHCLNQQNFRFHVSGVEEHGTSYWYLKFLQSLFGWHHALRRNLGEQSLAVSSPVPAPSLTSGPTSGPSVQPPSFGPALSPERAISPAQNGDSIAETPKPQNPQYSANGNTQSSTGVDPSGPSSAPPTNHRSISKRAVIIVVVVTASATFLLSALLFYCYNRCHRSNSISGDGQRDEGPLLALSFSDISLGTSPMSYGLQRANDLQKFGTVSLKTNPSQNGKSDISLKTSQSQNGKSDISKSCEIPSGPVPVIVATSSSEYTHSSDITLVPPHPLTTPPIKAASLPLGIPPPPSKSFGPSPPLPPLNSSRPPPPPPPKAPSPPLASPPTPKAPSPPPPPKAPGPPPPHKAPGAPPPPPMPSAAKASLRPPPPPMGALLPSRTGNGSKVTPPSIPSGLETGPSGNTGAPKTKLKPFFWDKVLANPDHSMVWHQIKSGSFQFNEEMIETLFGYNSAGKPQHERKESSLNDTPSQHVQIIDPKKSQNLAILLRALNVTTEEVCDALMEGNELPIEILQTLLKMAPTKEEASKLIQYNGELSLLGPGERFLKSLVGIPFAFKRMDALLFICSLQEEVAGIKESFETLEVACKELRSSRLFLKLLEAVLKTGNRMNDGTFRGGAQAFKLDTLLKLADVKGADGKTTLLHFVVQEIVRSEGARAFRAAKESGIVSSMDSDSTKKSDSIYETSERYHNLGLQAVSGLSDELENVKKAASLDADSLTGTVAKLSHSLARTKEFMNSEMKSLNEESAFHDILKSFVQHAEVDIAWLLEEQKRIRSLVESTTVYFHGNAGKDEGLHLFVIVRDFLGMLDKVCIEVKKSPLKVVKSPRDKEGPSTPQVQDPQKLLFPAIRNRRMDYSSSDEEV